MFEMTDWEHNATAHLLGEISDLFKNILHKVCAG